MFKTVESVLKRFPNRRGVGGMVGVLKTRETIKEVMDEYFGDYGDEVVKKIRVLSVKGGVVTISAPQLLGVEITTSAEKLLRRIADRLGSEYISRIKIRSGY